MYLGWKLSVNGIKLAIGGGTGTAKGRVQVTIDGKVCLTSGACACWSAAVAFIESIGGSIVSQWVTRVDLCLDLVNQPIAPLKLAFDERRYSTRAKKTWRGEWQSTGITFAVGGYPLQVRFYDKLAQLRSKSRDDIELMRQRRWNGVVPTAATRVEFQINRDALRARGIGTVEDYFDKRGDFVDYLTTKWFRMCERVPTRGNQNRMLVLPLWKSIRRGFAAWAGEPAGIPLKRLMPTTPDPTHLAQQLFGIVATLAAQTNQPLKSKKGLGKFSVKMILSGLPDDWRARVLKKRQEQAERLASSAQICTSGPTPKKNCAKWQPKKHKIHYLQALGPASAH